ncbi:IucA/IucC family C-terminal-domain containing protein [Solibacillus daqui]|uniref:IucA/IucC family C-terminal-domain containing protein n=1 Tax=Solibacillus daqui TaxID=2912187 RepID=UPI0023672927|nr:IucA/IucC family C-terminal-domain containing protein [Solibacillus daqui]
MNLTMYGVNMGQKGIPLEKLVDHDTLTEIVKQYAEYLETNSMAISASLFFKRYAVITAAAALDYYGFQKGTHNWLKDANFDINTFTINVQKSNIQLEEDWRKVLFLDHLHPICQFLAQEFKIPSKILWENVAVRLNRVLKRSVGHYAEDDIQLQVEALQEKQPNWFQNQNNPFAAYIVHPNEEKVRTTCCRYYQLTKKEEGVPYCLVCPLKK